MTFNGEARYNWSIGERDIIIKLADKGSKLVIMNRNQCPIEAYRQLNNKVHYLAFTQSLQFQTQAQIRENRTPVEKKENYRKTKTVLVW